MKIKAVLSLGCLLLGVSVLSSTGGAEVESPLPSILVLDFSNRAGDQYDFLKKPGADKLEILLAETGLFKVLERERMGEILASQKLNEFGEPATAPAIHLAEKAGADYVALGLIRDAGNQSRRYEGAYGEPSINLLFTLDMALKIVNARTGEIWHADEAKTSTIIRESPAVIVEQDDINDNLLETALEKMVGNLSAKFAAVKKPVAAGGGQVKIPISSQPAGADIVIDGTIRGNTPAEIEITRGVHLIELRLEGYAPWGMRIEPMEGLRINPTLLPPPPPPPPPPPGPSPAAGMTLQSVTVTEEYQQKEGGPK